MVSLFLTVLLLFCSGDLLAKQEPRSIAANNHIKVINYNPQAIHKYTGFYGYQSSILFEQGEVIYNLSMGDPTGWQIVPQDNRLFIKPIDDIADTNATIITNKRVYYFEFHAEEATGLDDPRLAYEVRFLYPLFNNDEVYATNNGDILEQASSVAIPDMNDIEVVKKGLNFDYFISHIKGSESIVPNKVFDDGKFTYLQFNKISSNFPAIFIVDSAGYESLVNFRTVNDYLIIERVGSVFTLRNGSSTVCIFNEGIPF
ncbi:P-type conjugative transfer protein VirB9 [Wolbachia endosymbiont of Cruorifilaria tuberocauda]|uniref:TrbG/VirB9 family P-type conjugative transfer protein n=1 Tax=Wolbachia endosymbiont of Cruorifilaria tuberocauda TaxID=1812111 RepID=UPI00158C3366|nr:TrbG/VirB9 family P-type conjugative transfer protein [Wolbachia endosymbiont of Cruorifilaria tuberocauda]QKX01958.1 P-type conjugative transfer protein VirB9 [Wolbachia endosymbiont of Cruorifilaria tuberocauda]